MKTQRSLWDRLNALNNQHKEFLSDRMSIDKAYLLSISAWHFLEAIFYEKIFAEGQGKDIKQLESFRETLYPKCQLLKVMHDLATYEKHSKVSYPKIGIEEFTQHIGFSREDFDNRDFDVSGLKIKLESGEELDFEDSIEAVIGFWNTYSSQWQQ